ncbi:MAG: GNAT family N-acetyltransferase [Candidatus Brocadiia bacterium]
MNNIEPQSKCPIDGCSLRPATCADIPAMFDLDRLHMKPAVDRNYPGQWDDDVANTIIAENLERAQVVEVNGQIVAFYYWWIEEPDIAVLHSIQVAASLQRKGLGTWLIGHFEAEARNMGARKVGLAVFDDNRAISLYRRLGYKVTGTDGPHAVEMEKNL